MNTCANCVRPDDTRNVTTFIEVSSDKSEKVEKIKGTDIPVWKVVKLHLEGSSIEEIVDRYPVLSAEEVRGAVGYYYCQRRRISRHFGEDEEVDYVTKSASQETRKFLPETS